MLRAAGGRVVLGDRRPQDPPLPDELTVALREWAAFAAAVERSGAAVQRDLVRRRGRQLAARLARLRGRPVGFVDPLSGSVETVLCGVSAHGLSGHGLSAHGVAARRSALALESPGPTPWATGSAVALFFAVLVAIGDVVLSTAFAEAFGLLWIPANLLVGLGLAPSLYLLRDMPFWRWVAFGSAAGLGMAWVVLLVGLLG